MNMRFDLFYTRDHFYSDCLFCKLYVFRVIIFKWRFSKMENIYGAQNNYN